MIVKSPIIEACSLTKTYADLRRGQFVALDNLSFEAHEGEVFGLLGPNGAGKTSTINMLCGLQKITNGQVGTVEILLFFSY